MLNHDLLAPFASLTSSVTWAIGGTLYSGLSRSHAAYAISFSRALAAGPLFLLVSLGVAGATWGTPLYGFQSLSLISVVYIVASTISRAGLADICFFMSCKELGVSGAMAISSAYPLVAALMAWAWNGEVPHAAQLCGMMLVVGGTVAVSLLRPKGNAEGAATQRAGLGVLMAVVTAVLWAGGAFFVSLVGKNSDPATINSLRMAATLAIAPVVGFLMPGPYRPFLEPKVFRTYAPLFAFESFVGSMLGVYGLAHCPLGVATALASLAPVFVIPFSIWRGAEPFSWKNICACLTVTGGTLLLVLG